MICVGHHYTQANTNKVNKTRAFLQTTGGKDEPSIGFKDGVLNTSGHDGEDGDHIGVLKDPAINVLDNDFDMLY